MSAGSFFRILNLQHELLGFEWIMHYLINEVLVSCQCMTSEDHCKILPFFVK